MKTNKLIKFILNDGTEEKSGKIKEIHGLRYVVEVSEGEIYHIYEADIIEGLTDKQYWDIVKELRKKENEKLLLPKESGPATPAIPTEG
jgi:hypothetical protein